MCRAVRHVDVNSRHAKSVRPYAAMIIWFSCVPIDIVRFRPLDDRQIQTTLPACRRMLRKDRFGHRVTDLAGLNVDGSYIADAKNARRVIKIDGKANAPARISTQRDLQSIIQSRTNVTLRE